ncbi:MAG: hypothetical protein J4203_03085 [Candidatus Diapherotrites archaeon]|uniref:Uncharacterized protein n=2 Tax=Candidatus Iainarchaeum sp. TaxID=3101447 RepID=A0A8T4LA66_9ARCH|nr:hypothetical protein [Candidatus Diapherotrites archaeon]
MTKPQLPWLKGRPRRRADPRALVENLVAKLARLGRIKPDETMAKRMGRMKLPDTTKFEKIMSWNRRRDNRTDALIARLRSMGVTEAKIVRLVQAEGLRQFTDARQLLADELGELRLKHAGRTIHAIPETDLARMLQLGKEIHNIEKGLKKKP